MAPIRLLVENRAEEIILRGIFSGREFEKQISVDMAWTSSGVISLADTLLLKTPEQPVILALNCQDRSQAAEFRAPIERILSRTALHDYWHVALAIPDILTAWAKSDPAFANHLRQGNFPTKYDEAAEFGRWTKSRSNPYDIDALCKRDPEFRAMHEFLQKHLSSVATTT